MLSVIESEAVLEAAREMNRRDVRRLELQRKNQEAGRGDTELPEANDDEIWARTEGVEGLRGVNGERLKLSGSFYSWGPYPRNRRILADIALAAGWSVEKARILERRCVRRMAKHFISCDKVKAEGLSDPNQPKQYGRPFTFQHISWSFLEMYIPSEMQEMDPGKMAAVKAAVLDRYEPNSKTGRKILPAYDPGTERISDDLPVSEADIQRAQEALDNKARYRAALDMELHDKTYLPPEQVKRRIKAFIVTHNMSDEDFCKAIDVTEEQLGSFMSERKKRPLQESKVFHNALAYMNRGTADEQPARKRRKRAEVHLS
ncbi:hypothetical protein DL764_004841 [Monosporascus ibericus]|uniref:DUF7726 domain-containing protein n=1 Tax=Monosporascus ibericus TaxID=155417 RepID=A0A4Q4TD28_9PEZI|nr:hypothetical protein DL764_004841 [Monosporascus ibericus]